MSVRVSFDITDAQYRALIPLCTAKDVTVNRLAHDRLAGLADAIIDGTFDPNGRPARRPGYRARIPYSDELGAKIRAHAAARHSRKATADLLGISVERLRDYAARAGDVHFDPRAAHPIREEDRDAFREYHLAGATQRQLMARFDATQAAVVDELKRQALTPHPRGRRTTPTTGTSPLERI